MYFGSLETGGGDIGESSRFKLSASEAIVLVASALSHMLQFGVLFIVVRALPGVFALSEGRARLPS